MKLQSLKVQNIRSIKNLDIEFPDSTVLFYGDIGSGKTSALKAVEFALFGTMGDLSGDSLLRRGERKAVAELTFIVDQNPYTIHRELKTIIQKGEQKVTQPKGWLIENDVKTSYTTTELRSKILEILNYSVSKYKSSSKKCIDIFRYSVYTPQEEIKAILLADPSERFDILKDVLEIEKYEYTLNNLEKIKKSLNKDISNLDNSIKYQGSPEEEIPKKEVEISDNKNEIKTKGSEITGKSNKLASEKKNLKKSQEEYNNYSKKITEFKTKQGLREKDQKSIKKNEGNLEKLKIEISKKQEELDSTPEVSLKSEKGEELLESEITSLRDLEVENNNDKTKTQVKLENIDKLLKDGICSLCGREIHDKERFNKELKSHQEQLKFSKEKEIKIKKDIKEVVKLQKNAREYEINKEKRNGIKEIIREKQLRENDLSEAIKQLKEKVETANDDINSILDLYKMGSIEELELHENEIVKKVESRSKIVDTIQSELTTLEKELSSTEERLKKLETELTKMKEQLKKKKMLKEKKDYINIIRDWVSDQLKTLIKDIERTILTTTASDFNQYFKEWFKALVEEENIDIEINPENFQPIVIVNGYESPFNDMSGGEKSALSLAYRLALNKVINIKHQNVKTKDLLILDEPTDGFSEQQVNKMQEVFTKLNTKQIIIISHERTLDSFVAEVFNFKKVNHQTKVSKERA